MPQAPRVYKTPAIVLRQRKLGDTDKILTLYTANLGKLEAVVKGVRKTRSRLAGHVEPLTQATFMLAKGKSLDIVTQVETIESFQPLRDDPDPTYHRMGVALDAVVAPGYQSHYNGVVWAPLPVPPQMRNRMPAAVQQRPTVDYAAQRQQTAETAAYAGAYFLIGCVFFTRRDLKFS